MRALVVLLVVLAGCDACSDAPVVEGLEFEACAFADEPRVCVLELLKPGECIELVLGDEPVCFPRLYQHELATRLARAYCVGDPRYWCFGETWHWMCEHKLAGGGCDAVVTDGVALDACLSDVTAGSLPLVCTRLFPASWGRP